MKPRRRHSCQLRGSTSVLIFRCITRSWVQRNVPPEISMRWALIQHDLNARTLHAAPRQKCSDDGRLRALGSGGRINNKQLEANTLFAPVLPRWAFGRE